MNNMLVLMTVVPSGTYTCGVSSAATRALLLLLLQPISIVPGQTCSADKIVWSCQVSTGINMFFAADKYCCAKASKGTNTRCRVSTGIDMFCYGINMIVLRSMCAGDAVAHMLLSTRIDRF